MVSHRPGRIQGVGRRVRILVCNYEYPPIGGGGGVVTAALMRELARRNTKVTVLTLPCTGSARVVVRRSSSSAAAADLFPHRADRREHASDVHLPRRGFPERARPFSPQRVRHREYPFCGAHGPPRPVDRRPPRGTQRFDEQGGGLYDPSRRMSPHRHAWLRRTVRSVLQRAGVVIANSSNTARQRVQDLRSLPRRLHRAARNRAPRRRSRRDARCFRTSGRRLRPGHDRSTRRTQADVAARGSGGAQWPERATWS